MDTKLFKTVSAVLIKFTSSKELAAAWAMFMATTAQDIDNETFLRLVCFYGDLLAAVHVREIAAADSKKEV